MMSEYDALPTNNRPCPNQQLDKIFDTTKEGSKEILHFDIQDLYQRYKVLNPNPKFLSIYIYCTHHRKAGGSIMNYCNGPNYVRGSNNIRSLLVTGPECSGGDTNCYFRKRISRHLRPTSKNVIDISYDKVALIKSRREIG